MTAERDEFWDSAVRRHDRQVFLSLLAMGVRPEEARDIAQATWTTLVEKQASGALSKIELPGLAIRQARFLALNDFRRSNVEKQALRVVSEDAGEVGDTRREVASRETVSQLLDALADCSPNAKKIFRLVYGRPPHTHEQVAREVGLSLQRVRQILCETRAQLRTAIEGEVQ